VVVDASGALELALECGLGVAGIVGNRLLVRSADLLLIIFDS
jgi:hypothetical protein